MYRGLFSKPAYSSHRFVLEDHQVASPRFPNGLGPGILPQPFVLDANRFFDFVSLSPHSFFSILPEEVRRCQESIF
jgi:hypothetical protein